MTMIKVLTANSNPLQEFLMDLGMQKPKGIFILEIVFAYWLHIQ